MARFLSLEFCGDKVVHVDTFFQIKFNPRVRMKKYPSPMFHPGEFHNSRLRRSEKDRHAHPVEPQCAVDSDDTHILATPSVKARSAK